MEVANFDISSEALLINIIVSFLEKKGLILPTPPMISRFSSQVFDTRLLMKVAIIIHVTVVSDKSAMIAQAKVFNTV